MLQNTSACYTFNNSLSQCVVKLLVTILRKLQDSFRLMTILQQSVIHRMFKTNARHILRQNLRPHSRRRKTISISSRKELLCAKL